MVFVILSISSGIVLSFRFDFYFVFEIVPHCVAQADLQILGSRDRLASASWVARATGTGEPVQGV